MAYNKLLLLILFYFFATTGKVYSQTKIQHDNNQKIVDSPGLDEIIELNNRLYLEAIKTNNQNDVFTSLSGMFDIFLQSGNYEKSFEYVKQLYNISLKSDNKLWSASTFRDLGKLYTAIGDYKHALNYYRRVWEMSDQEVINDRIRKSTEFNFQMEFSELFSLTNQFDSAWYYYKLFKPSKEIFTSTYLISTGECYFNQGNFKQALGNFESGFWILLKSNDPKETIRAFLDISKTDLALDNYNGALKYGREGLQLAIKERANQYSRDGYNILSDVFDRLNQMDSSNFYFRKYSILKDVVLDAQSKGKMAAYTYEQQISLMNKENEIQQMNLQKQTMMKNVLIGSVIILILFAFIFSRNIILKRKAALRLKELAENELQIQKLEGEKSRIELLQQQTELEMKALRAQMNPHFIFNCLNSINRFIIQNEAEKAADYLTKFAKLIRIVLENSGNPFITLGEEMNCLRLYMDLEAIRFERPFEYEIESNGIDMDAVLIPSLIIQPFVENAIWHGLINNINIQGIIRINIYLENEVLKCEISDNGIGILKSLSLKAQNSAVPKSLGIEFTKHRLVLLNESVQENSVLIHELKDEEGNINGTIVYLKIPVLLT